MNLVTSSAITMSSREIAELVGSKHEAVRKSAQRLAADRILTSPLAMSDYEHRGNTYWEYRFEKRDCLVLVARLSPAFTAQVIDRWQELESAPQEVKPLTHLETARLLVSSLEQIEQQAQQLAIAAPKVEFVDKYVEATGLKGFRQVAKLLGAKENDFREFLCDNKIMYRLGAEWVPYANHIDAGRFEVKTGASDTGHAFNQAKFTPKGVAYVAGLWNKSGAEPCGS